MAIVWKSEIVRSSCTEIDLCMYTCTCTVYPTAVVNKCLFVGMLDLQVFCFTVKQYTGTMLL